MCLLAATGIVLLAVPFLPSGAEPHIADSKELIQGPRIPAGEDMHHASGLSAIQMFRQPAAQAQQRDRRRQAPCFGDHGRVANE